MKEGNGPTKMKSLNRAGPGEPTHEEIAARAYELFLQRGEQHGHDQEDWLKAEAEIRRRRDLASISAQRWSGIYR